jgi:hypothetical protein
LHANFARAAAHDFPHQLGRFLPERARLSPKNDKRGVSVMAFGRSSLAAAAARALTYNLVASLKTFLGEFFVCCFADKSDVAVKLSRKSYFKILRLKFSFKDS